MMMLRKQVLGEMYPERGELRPAPQYGSLLQAMTARRPRDSSGLAHPSDREMRFRNPRKRCGSPVGKVEFVSSSDA